MSKDKLSKALGKIQEELEKADIMEKGPEIIPPDEYLSEKVPFMAFKDNDKYKDDIVVTINGKTWVIQRGVQVFIPRFVLHALENSQRQKNHSANVNQELAENFRRYESQLV